MSESKEYVCTVSCMSRVRRIKRGEHFTEAQLASANGGVMPDAHWIAANFMTDDGEDALPREDGEVALGLSKGEDTPLDDTVDNDPAPVDADGNGPAPIDADGNGFESKAEMIKWLISQGQTPKKSATKAELQEMINRLKGEGDW